MNHNNIIRPNRLSRAIIDIIEHEYPVAIACNKHRQHVPIFLIEMDRREAQLLRTRIERRLRELTMSHAQSKQGKEVQCGYETR